MKWLKEFPTQGGTVFTALVLIFVAGMTVNLRLVRGLPFPPGYEPWLIFLATLAGVTTTGMVLKRATEKPEVIRAEGEAKAAVVAAATTGTHPVLVPGEQHLPRIEQPSAVKARDAIARAPTVRDD